MRARCAECFRPSPLDGAPRRPGDDEILKSQFHTDPGATLSLKRVDDWCRTHRHDDLHKQQHTLSQKLRGHYGYFGITGNTAALERFSLEVRRVWFRWLRRRSQRARLNWERMQKLLERYPLPRPRIQARRAANP